MAVNYSNAVKSTLANAVIAAIDGGPSAGTLEICTAAYASVLAIITLNDPCGTQVNGLITYSGMPKTTNPLLALSAAVARVKDSTGTVIFDGLTVGTSGTDIIVGTTAFNLGNVIQITSATHQVQ